MITSKEKADWLAALRSGEYTQGKDYLAHRESKEGGVLFCCLGVLGAVCGIDLGDLLNQSDLGDLKREDLLGEYSNYPEKTLQAQLADMNDNGRSFDFIADWIEKNVETSDAKTGVENG